MISCGYLKTMATYNEWMNAKMYEAAARLPPAELAAERNAFFGSIIGTLNHVVVGDTIWLKRFADHPTHFPSLDPVRALAAPSALNEIVFAEIDELRERRRLLDAAIGNWAAQMTEEDLRQILCYANMKGVAQRKRMSGVVMHFFNHQTHHRGQTASLLTQAGQDIGVTDLITLIPDENEA